MRRSLPGLGRRPPVAVDFVETPILAESRGSSQSNFELNSSLHGMEEENNPLLAPEERQEKGPDATVFLAGVVFGAILVGGGLYLWKKLSPMIMPTLETVP